MTIVNIKINTDRLGDTPEVKINGRDVKVLYHIDFNWTTSKESVPSISKLNIKHWPNYIHNTRMNENLDFDRNKIVMHDSTWTTALY